MSEDFYSSPAPFDGTHFHNPGIDVPAGFNAVIRWQLNRQKQVWPEHVELSPTLPLKEIGKGHVSCTFINHATVLLRYHGLNIITDPVFSKRVSPLTWAGPSRVHAPAIALERLPKIDVVLVSHNHYDHMDRESLRALKERFDPLFVVPLKNAKILRRFGIKKIEELDWWQSLKSHEAKITLVPAQHWSSRSLFDRNRALWGGFVVDRDQHKSYFAGDTGYASLFKDIHARFGAMDLSLLPIGAYAPRWFMRPQHMDPADAVNAHRDLHSRFSIGIHFGTFQLTDEGRDEPIHELTKALDEAGFDKETFLAPTPGASFALR